MQPQRRVLVLLLVAIVALGGCTSTEMIRFDTPQRIDTDPSLQFDFTLPLLGNAYHRRIRVNVSYDGEARFYMRDNHRPYVRIKALLLTAEEIAHLARFFEEADFARYPVIVPRKGQVSTPAYVVQLGYRSKKGGVARTVSGAISTQRNVEAYPTGFFELIDGLADFIEGRGKFRIHSTPGTPALSAAGSE